MDLKKKKINKLVFDEDNIHYIYKECDFLYKNRNKENLVIFFHGALNMENISPYTFRGYNYDFKNADILSISDLLVKKFYKHDPKILLGWYLTTDKYNHFDIYKEILDSIVNKYSRVIIASSSGGGYASLLFASVYHCECLVTNIQIYLDKYKYYDILKNIIQIKDSDINIESKILKYGSPGKIYLYSNKKDKHHYEHHALPFELFMKKHFPNNILTYFFDDTLTPEKDHHTFYFPENKKLNEMVEEVLRI